MKKDFDGWNTEKKALDASADGTDCHEREIWWCAIGINIGSEQLSQTDNFSRPVVVVPKDVFAVLVAAIINAVAIKTTDPARAGSSEAEANV